MCHNEQEMQVCYHTKFGSACDKTEDLINLIRPQTWSDFKRFNRKNLRHIKRSINRAWRQMFSKVLQEQEYEDLI